MAGSHLSSGSASYSSSRSNKRRRRGGAGIVVLIIALVIIVAVLGCFVASNVFGISLFDGIPLISSSSSSGTSVNGTTVAVYDANGKDVTKNVNISAGTLAPDTMDSSAASVLLNTSWSGMLATNYPVIISVSNMTFTNDDGLKVYQYNGTGWTELGTYLIADNTVSFQTYSLSAFAFEIISSEPEATPTPEPTATPEAEEEPTVDYGSYDTEVDGLFVDTDYITADGEYIIGVLDDSDEDNITATVVLHYGEGELAAMDVALQQTESGRYYVLDPVVEGMLWKAVNSDNVVDFDRYALANNDEHLNLNDDCTEFVLDNDPNGRTRWLYEAFSEDGSEMLIDEDDDTSEGFLTYYNETVLYYLDSTDDFTATSNRDDSLKIVLFCLNGSTERPLSDEEEVEADVAKTTSTYSGGTINLTDEPTGVSGVNATPRPTAVAPQNTNSAVIPVTSDTPATTAPTAAPVVVTDTPSGGGTSGGGTSGGGSDSGSTSGGGTSGGGSSASSGSDSGSGTSVATGR